MCLFCQLEAQHVNTMMCLQMRRLFEEKLHLDDNKEIHAMKTHVRRVPIALKQDIKKELDRSPTLGVVAKADTPRFL